MKHFSAIFINERDKLDELFKITKGYCCKMQQEGQLSVNNKNKNIIARYNELLPIIKKIM